MKCLRCDMGQGLTGGRVGRTHPEMNDRSESQRLSADLDCGEFKVINTEVLQQSHRWMSEEEAGGQTDRESEKQGRARREWHINEGKENVIETERVWLSESEKEGVWKNRGTKVDFCLNDRQKNNPPVLWVKSSYSTLDVTLQDSLLKHYTVPPGPARTLLDNYYLAMTTELPEALILHQSSSSRSLSLRKFSQISHMQVSGVQLQAVRRAGGFS